MGDVDNTLKTLADRHASDYVHWLLGASYKVVEKIGTELPKTTSRLADFVYLVEEENQAPFILQKRLLGKSYQKSRRFLIKL